MPSVIPRVYNYKNSLKKHQERSAKSASKPPMFYRHTNSNTLTEIKLPKDFSPKIHPLMKTNDSSLVYNCTKEALGELYKDLTGTVSSLSKVEMQKQAKLKQRIMIREDQLTVERDILQYNYSRALAHIASPNEPQRYTPVSESHSAVVEQVVIEPQFEDAEEDENEEDEPAELEEYPIPIDSESMTPPTIQSRSLELDSRNMEINIENPIEQDIIIAENISEKNCDISAFEIQNQTSAVVSESSALKTQNPTSAIVSENSTILTGNQTSTVVSGSDVSKSTNQNKSVVFEDEDGMQVVLNTSNTDNNADTETTVTVGYGAATAIEPSVQSNVDSILDSLNDGKTTEMTPSKSPNVCDTASRVANNVSATKCVEGVLCSAENEQIDVHESEPVAQLSSLKIVNTQSLQETASHDILTNCFDASAASTETATTSSVVGRLNVNGMEDSASITTEACEINADYVVESNQQNNVSGSNGIADTTQNTSMEIEKSDKNKSVDLIHTTSESSCDTHVPSQNSEKTETMELETDSEQNSSPDEVDSATNLLNSNVHSEICTDQQSETRNFVPVQDHHQVHAHIESEIHSDHPQRETRDFLQDHDQVHAHLESEIHPDHPQSETIAPLPGNSAGDPLELSTSHNEDFSRSSGHHPEIKEEVFDPGYMEHAYDSNTSYHDQGMYSNQGPRSPVLSQPVDNSSFLSAQTISPNTFNNLNKKHSFETWSPEYNDLQCKYLSLASQLVDLDEKVLNHDRRILVLKQKQLDLERKISNVILTHDTSPGSMPMKECFVSIAPLSGEGKLQHGGRHCDYGNTQGRPKGSSKYVENMLKSSETNCENSESIDADTLSLESDMSPFKVPGSHSYGINGKRLGRPPGSFTSPGRLYKAPTYSVNGKRMGRPPGSIGITHSYRPPKQATYSASGKRMGRPPGSVTINRHSFVPAGRQPGFSLKGIFLQVSIIICDICLYMHTMAIMHFSNSLIAHI